MTWIGVVPMTCTCKDCMWFSDYLGGTCLGWADMSETNESTEVGSCSRFELRHNRRYEYIPNEEEMYSRYDYEFDKFP